MQESHTPVPLLDINRGNAAIRDDLVKALTEVVDSGRFLHGPQVTQLEQEVARLCNTNHAVGCASGSDALLLALMAFGIQPGEEVIVPSFTFFATASAVSRLGATPVFADIDPRTYNISPQEVAAKITRRTRAIIPVHLFGQSAAMTDLCNLAGNREILVVEDAAQAIGAAYHGRPVCGWGQVGCLSFYPTKNLGGFGDGGMLAVQSDTLADKLRLLASHGMRPRYYHSEIGINSRLDTLQAAGLLVKLKHLEAYTTARRQIANRYMELFAESRLVASGDVELPYQDPAAFHVWNQYSLRIRHGKRNSLRQYLTEHKVGSEIYYPVPLHEQVCFRHLGYQPTDLPETHLAAQEILHLPIYPDLTAQEQLAVVQQINEYFQTLKNRAVA